MSYKRKYQSAGSAMDKKVVFIDGMATAKDAVSLMRREKVNALIVNKRDETDAFGIVTLKDLINGVIIPDRTSEEVNVYEIMNKPVISVPADMDVRYVARLLMKTGLRIAPVEDNGTFAGMISLTTIILDNIDF
ncbi:MAG: CBS domain-containing protein [Bacteroidales bacterium]